VKIGCHISIRKGYLQAAKTAEQIGAGAFQYFPKNPRSLSIKTFDRGDAEACARYCREHGIASIAHAPYPVNLAVADELKRRATVESVLNDLEIVEACGSIGLVVHFGKFKGGDLLTGYKNVLQCLNEILSRWRGNALILLENQAGEGTSIGTRFEELLQIRALAVRPEKIAYCFDTCHAFASGLWKENSWTEAAAEGEKLGFFSLVKAVHLNDSAYPSGSRRDRHANIGRGCIGWEQIGEFMRSSWIKGLPVILETPSGPLQSHQQEILTLQQQFS
jgi:deoxyribonuclease-4